MFNKHWRARAETSGSSRLLAAWRKRGDGGFAERDQLTGRGVMDGGRGVRQLLDEAGDGAFINGGAAAFMKEIEQRRPGSGDMGRLQGVFIRGGKGRSGRGGNRLGRQGREEQDKRTNGHSGKLRDSTGAQAILLS